LALAPTIFSATDETQLKVFQDDIESPELGRAVCVAVVSADDEIVFSGDIHDVRKIVAALAADGKSTSPQKVLCIPLSTLQLVTFVKILKHVREPLRAGSKKSDLEFWKALRNFIHDHVMERADDD
jgi:hypothetical protein